MVFENHTKDSLIWEGPVAAQPFLCLISGMQRVGENTTIVSHVNVGSLPQPTGFAPAEVMPTLHLILSLLSLSQREKPLSKSDRDQIDLTTK